MSFGWPRGLLSLALGFGLLASVPVHGEDDPRGWLERMAGALEGLNYEGTLLHLNGSDATVLRIIHRVENGVPTERITAMDDVGREIIRRGDEVTCILPDQRSVLVEQGPAAAGKASPLRRQFSAGTKFDDAYYRLAIASGGRLVGRPTRVVTVRSTDNYRYGYRLWLDEATAMPLKIQIAGDDGAVVEQLLFSDISLPDQIPAERVQPSAALDSFTWHRPAEGGTGSDSPGPGRATGWHARVLPPGFVLRAVRSQPMNAGEPPTQQLVYSDGLASVSVFIAAGAPTAEQDAGVSRMGAANAFTTVSQGHLITAVGEVPVRTVEAIARSVENTSHGTAADASPGP